MRNVNKLLWLALLVMGSYWAGAQNLTWTQEPSYHSQVFSNASFAIGNDVYVMGGYYGPYTGYPATMEHQVWDFNTVSNTWTRKADFPGIATYGGKGFTIGSYGYLVSGWDSTGSGSGPNTTWQYDPATDTWTAKAAFPGSTRYTTATFAVAGKGYVACGFSPYKKDVYCYDPASDSWSQKADFPGTARQDLPCFVIGNYAYAGMGATSNGMGGYFLESDFYKYDPATDTWTRLGNFPGDAISGGFSFVINDEGYVMNGNNQNSVLYNSPVGSNNKVWKYTPATDTWSLWGIFPTAATFGGMYTSCNGAGYMGQGGYNFALSSVANYFYRLGPGTAPYSCNVTLNKYQISNAVYNFQASGNFSPTAEITWNFGDGQTGTGTSVIHNYTAVGHYPVVVIVHDTASSCSNSATDSVVITNINNCSVSILNTNYGELYTLSTIVTGGAGPYHYAWTNPADSTFISTSPDPVVTIPYYTPATYCVSVTDTTGCVASACTTIADTPIVYTPCQIYLVVYPDPNIPGAYYSVLYTTGAGNLSYMWDFGDGTTSNLQFPTHTYAVPGNYTVCLTVSDGAGCSFSFCDSSFYAYKYGGGPMQQFSVARQVTLGLHDVSGDHAISLYPNPASKEISIVTNGQKLEEAALYNMNGQLLATADLSRGKINVEALPDGIYVVEVKANGSSTKMKFAKVSK